MKSENPSVALIFGGRGFEHDISIRGAEYVYPLIDTKNYNKIPVYVRRDGAWIIPAMRSIPACPRALADEAIPVMECSPVFINSFCGLKTESSFVPILSAFPLLHGDYGEDGVVQGALENARIPYVGCNTQASAVARDKCYVKLIAKHLGIPTAKWLYVTGEPDDDAFKNAEKIIGYPMFIKPARLGSSVGAGVACCREDLIKLLTSALKMGSGRALIEERITVSKELECGYFSTKSKELFTRIGEISFENGFYDYEAKYHLNTAKIFSQAEISFEEERLLHSYARRLVAFLGLRGISRIDFFRTKDGEIYFNEINTMPGFTEKSLYPRLMEESGISPSELINLLISDATQA